MLRRDCNKIIEFFVLRGCMSQLFIIILASFISGCFWSDDFRSIETIKNSGQLTVLTRSSSTTFYRNKEGLFAGFEFELASLYAKHIGVELKMINVPSFEIVLSGVKEGRGDIAAASLTKTAERLKDYSASRPINTIRQKLVCHPSFKGESFKDIIGKKLVVVDGSSYDERLKWLKKVKYPNLKWSTIDNLSSDQVLQLVWEGGPDCTVLDSNIAQVQKRFMPELRIIDDVSEDQDIVWYTNKKNSPLMASINKWLQQEDTKANVERLTSRYYGEFGGGYKYNLKSFVLRIKADLKKYKKLFVSTGQRYDIPWQLIAAASYQLSNWDERAFHPSGGKGLMLITKAMINKASTGDPLDPGRNIVIGVSHLKALMNDMPISIPPNERLWLALAAYNIGWHHIEDARKIAAGLNYNPNTWNGVKKALPLLSQKHYYKDLKYGFAQGVEPLLFVKRIKQYYNVLKKQ